MLRKWIFFDDTSVKEKEDWSAVVQLITNGKRLSSS